MMSVLNLSHRAVEVGSVPCVGDAAGDEARGHRHATREQRAGLERETTDAESA